MTKWIIVSDNHTEQGVLFDVINHHSHIDVAIHLGDSEFAYDDSELSHFIELKEIQIFILNFLMKRL